MVADFYLNLTITTEADTERIGRDIAGLAQVGDIIALSGDLGTGKTVLARAFIQALGGREEVPSPTFNLVQSYDLGWLMVHHLDLYRIENPEDVFELGIEELFATGVSLIEWPDRLGAQIPKDRLNFNLFHPKYLAGSKTARRITIEGLGAWQSRFEKLSEKLDDD